MYVVLEALDGPSVGARTNVAAGQTVRIGREAGNDFVVPQDPTLSRCHFHLYYDGANCFLQNQSRYGTFVNNQRIDTEGPVRDGDELRAGVCRFAVRFASDESVRDSTTPEMLAIRDDEPPVAAYPVGNAAGYGAPVHQSGGQHAAAYGGLPPIEEDEPLPPPGSSRPAPAAYGLPPIAEDEPIAEPGSRGTMTGTGQPAAKTPHAHAVAQPAAMNGIPPIKVDETGLRAEPVPELLGRVRLDDEAKSIAAGAASARSLVDTLVAQGLKNDALKIIAAALPPQAAVRWVIRCVRETGDLSKGDVAALAAAERWTADPSEANRREAQAAAEKLEYGTAASWAAVAAFWSGGSMAPPNVPPVPPPPDLMPQALFGAVSLAAVAQGGEKAEEMQQRFLTFGLEPQPQSR